MIPGLELELRAASSDQVENVNVSLVGPNDNIAYAQSEPTIPVGQTETVNLPNITSSENTNTFDVSITYDVGGLTDLTTNGTLTGRMQYSGS